MRGLVLLAAFALALIGCGDDSDDRTGLPVDESSQLAVDRGGAWVARDRKLVRVGNDGKEVGPVALPSRPSAWATGGGALWTAGDGALQRVDPATRRPVGEPIELPAAPDSFAERIAVGGDTVWVETGDRVQRVDARTGEVLGQTSAPGGFVTELLADAEAAYFVSTPSADKGSDTVITRVDAATGAVKRVQLDPERGIFFAQIALGAGELWVTQSRKAAERGKAYQQPTATVTRLDAGTLEPRGRPTSISPDPYSIAVTDDTAWIVDRGGDIAVVDTRTGARRPSPPPLDGYAALASGGRAMFAWERGGKLHRFDARSSEPLGEPRDVGEVPGQIVVSGDGVWLRDEPTQDPESDDEPPWSLTRVAAR